MSWEHWKGPDTEGPIGTAGVWILIQCVRSNLCFKQILDSMKNGPWSREREWNCIYFYPFFLLGKKMKTWHIQNSGGVKHCIGQNYWPMNCPSLPHRVRVCVKTFYTPTASVNNEHKQGDLWGKLKVTNRMPLKINKTNQPTHASNSSDSTMQINPIMEYRRIKWSGSKSLKGHLFFCFFFKWPSDLCFIFSSSG